MRSGRRAGRRRALKEKRGIRKRAAPSWLTYAVCLESVLHDLVHHRRIGEGRRIAKLIDLSGGDLPQDPSHDLTRPRLGETRDELEFPGRGDGADLFSHVRHQLFLQVVAPGLAHLEDNISVEVLALHVMGEADDSGLSHCRVGHEGALDLGCSEPVARDIDHVIDAAEEPEVPVFITPCAVPGEIEARLLDKIGRVEPLRDHYIRLSSCPAMTF